MKEMLKECEYYLIKADILPEVFRKVIEVKLLLNSGKIKSVNQAVKTVGMSRSAYYKYREAILPFYDTAEGKVVTLVFTVENFPGLLSEIINRIGKAKANILTINQNIPINGLADISIAVETKTLNITLANLVDKLNGIAGVRSCRIIARD